MSGKRYSDEFRAEAAKQAINQRRSVREVSTRRESASNHCTRGSGSSARWQPRGMPMFLWRRRIVACRPSSSG